MSVKNFINSVGQLQRRGIMEDKLCPCDECLCKPACKHKFYRTLIAECSILRKYFGHNSIPFNMCSERDRKLKKLFNDLNPSSWYITFDNCYKVIEHRRINK
jgi:hypothetical protein